MSAYPTTQIALFQEVGSPWRDYRSNNPSCRSTLKTRQLKKKKQEPIAKRILKTLISSQECQETTCTSQLAQGWKQMAR